MLHGVNQAVQCYLSDVALPSKGSPNKDMLHRVNEAVQCYPVDAVQSSCAVTLWMLPVEDLLTEVSCMELTGQYIVTQKMLSPPINSLLPCGCCPCSLASQLPCGCCLISPHSYPVDVAQYRFTLTLWILLNIASLLPCGCCPISLHSYPVDVA